MELLGYRVNMKAVCLVALCFAVISVMNYNSRYSGEHPGRNESEYFGNVVRVGLTTNRPFSSYWELMAEPQPVEIKDNSQWKIREVFHDGQTKQASMAFYYNNWNAAKSGVTDMKSCSEICSTEHFPVALYRIVPGGARSCLCQNYYSAVERNSRNFKNKYQVSISYNMNEVLVHRRKQCRCMTKNCSELTCSANAISCWIGPPNAALRKHKIDPNGTCDENHYQVQSDHIRETRFQRYTRSTNLARFCLPKEDWRGFWPLNTESCIIVNETRRYKVSCKNCKDIPVIMKPKQDQKKILIAASWRSGSTLSSELFAGISNSLYVFEPLLFQAYNRYSSTDAEALRAARGLIDIYNCDLQALPAGTYNKFKQITRLNEICHLTPQNYLDCVAILTSQCGYADVITIKTIRTSLTVMDHMVSELPDLKVVLVIRDPRAQILSQSHRTPGRKSAQWFIEKAKSMCSEQMKDMIKYKELSSRYPGQIDMYRYEDLVENSTGIVQNVYKNIGLGEPPNGTLDKLNKLTHGEKSDSFFIKPGKGIYGTSRTNSEQAAYKWKDEYSFSVIQKMDKECLKSYQLTGYQAVPNLQQLHNLNNHHRTAVNKR